MVAKATTIGPGLLTIGSDGELTNFSGQVRGGKLTPSVTKGDAIDVLSGEQLPGDRSESFALVVNLQADFGEDDSRDEWLWEHRGETHDFVYVPNNAKGRRINGQIVVEAVEIGGDVKSKPAHEVTFDLVGAPVFDDIA